MSHDCLIVLDTLGIRPSAAIVGISALRFDLDNPATPIDEFTVDINVDSNRRANRTYDGETLAWWAHHPNNQEVFTREGVELYEALELFNQFHDGVTNLWLSGAGFEASVLANAYHQFELQPPWPHWAITCARTTANLAAWLTGKQVAPTIIGDTALETAYQRLAALQESYNILKCRADRKGALSA